MLLDGPMVVGEHLVSMPWGQRLENNKPMLNKSTIKRFSQTLKKLEWNGNEYEFYTKGKALGSMRSFSDAVA